MSRGGAAGSIRQPGETTGGPGDSPIANKPRTQDLRNAGATRGANPDPDPSPTPRVIPVGREAVELLNEERQIINGRAINQPIGGPKI